MWAVYPHAATNSRTGGKSYPLSPHRCWGVSGAGSGRATGMLSRVGSTSSMSGRLAPATSTPIGTPRPSVSRDRLVPILARSVGFLPVFFSPEGRFGHGPVDALPVPVDADHLVVLVQGGLPE